MDVLAEILYPAVDQAQGVIESADRLEKRPDCPLFSEGGLDSLGLVRFIVMVEENIEEKTGKEVTLASERAMSRKKSPFRTLQTLAEYIDECLLEAEAS